MTRAKPPSLLYLSRHDVESLAIAPVELVDAVERMFRAKAEGRAEGTHKTSLYPGEGRLHQTMLARAQEPPYFAIKCVGLSPGNHARGLPHIGALLVLHDGETGMPVSVMDANWLTAMRTAAMSGAAARRLARPDSRSVGFVACGAQAESHLAVMRALFPIERLVAYGRRRETAEALAASAAAAGIAATVAARAEDAVRGIDIVVTSVPAAPDQRPELEQDWLAPGSFVAMVDLGRSWRKDGFAAFDRIATDDHGQSAALGKAGKLPWPGPFAADLGELVCGSKPGRTSVAERTAFLFPGFALGDLAAGALIYERARSVGRGIVLPL
ncbi:MAG: ornithine cyclodeaminase family protein [Alphaproteobacteria bacterium]|nr:ornithine cyclodeaminase family protein [Alphaproteobacteria bacterium]